MLDDVRQNELDIAEEKFFNSIFGSTDLDPKMQWLLKFLNIDINKQIQNFENIMKPLMLDNGLVNVELVKSLYPSVSRILPNANFRLVELVDSLSIILKGVRR